MTRTRRTLQSEAPRVSPYPIALDLAGRRCVVVGGGAVAERKVRGLLAAGAVVTAIAPDLTPGLRSLASAGTIIWEERSYATGDLVDATLAFAATNRRAVNARVAAEARAVGALVNVADAPDEGDFSVPAVLRRDRLTVSVSTEGGSPIVAGLIRDRLADALGDGYITLLDLVTVVREETLATGHRYSPDDWRAALTPEVVALAEVGNLAAANARLREALEANQPADRSSESERAINAAT